MSVNVSVSTKVTLYPSSHMQITNEAIHWKYIIEPYNNKNKKSHRLNSFNLS
jgi:hypothetical protein